MLVGPKGGGKSFIGELMQQHFDITFLRVESWVKDLRKDRAISREGYLTEVFNTIEAGVRKALEENDQVVFESTALTKQFETMFESLKHDYAMTTIGVWATHIKCMERIRSRDQSIHIQVSEEEIRAINSMVVDRAAKTDFKLENNDATAVELVVNLKEILSS